jgi:hypothetical protein
MDLWVEWTDESRREFLAKVVREVVVTPAHRKPVPVNERGTVRLLNIEGVDHGLEFSGAAAGRE